MAYVPPAPNAVSITFSAPYTAPGGHAVNLAFTTTAIYPTIAGSISFTGLTPALALVAARGRRAIYLNWE
jgi:hypothetical protein